MTMRHSLFVRIFYWRRATTKRDFTCHHMTGGWGMKQRGVPAVKQLCMLESMRKIPDMLKNPWIQRFDHDIYFDLLFHAVVNFYRSGVFPAVPACIAVCGNFPLFQFCGNFPLFHFARLIMHARRLDNYQQCCI